ncbi:E2F transcription factor-like E2FF isoform X2 [Dioscorea cayenensis subsp. rotundata]|uniref:E2F transcription factor-like E2FF isoform X2 n=1 Tax=Dioscorea cayennensis subsp. rotundata TaxID=55577 RepID=A0AB40CQK3_DIOCR|nr:E2F transcription factor-like E2FF isoform X2 [Dioscorea cayenensis subsp. rotundata]
MCSIFDPSAVRHQSYDRKQKSLGLLCSNFVKLYDREGVDTVGLDDAARQLGVERRRIYDIVNVLESVGILAKVGKNRYSWIGFSGIPDTLHELKEEALREMPGSAVDLASLEPEGLDDVGDQNPKSSQKFLGSKSLESLEEKKASLTPSCCTTSSSITSKSVTNDNKKEKSLGQLTQNFVKLFLISNADTISLDEAAKMLLGDGNNAAKVRRLYDIANVLSSVNLIEKTQQPENKKPAFRWLGYPKTDNKVEVATPEAKTKSKRVFGTDITTKADFSRNKTLSMEEKKHGGPQMTEKDPKDCNPVKRRKLQSMKDYDFGPFSPVKVAKESSHTQNKNEGAENLENLTSCLRPQYKNPGLNSLFMHYFQAWESWHKESTEINHKNPFSEFPGD